MRQEDIIWAAGFLDGEGTITIKRYSPVKGQSYRFQPYVSCVQSQGKYGTEAIQFLKELFGGCVTFDEQTKFKGFRRRPTISWAVVSNDAKKCIREIRPYLRVKQEQAKLLLQFCDEIVKTPGKKRLPQEEISRRDNLWFEMRKLNVKGVLHLQRLNEVTRLNGM